MPTLVPTAHRHLPSDVACCKVLTGYDWCRRAPEPMELKIRVSAVQFHPWSPFFTGVRSEHIGNV